MKDMLLLIGEVIMNACFVGIGLFFLFYAWQHKPLNPSDVYFTMAILLMSVAARERSK